MRHVTELFVDEAVRGDYLLCVAVVAAGDIAAARKIMRELKPKNRDRLHMNAESPRNRARIVSQFVAQPPISEAHVFVRPRQAGVRESQREARTLCLEALAGFAADTTARRILVESCSQDEQDIEALADILAERKALDRVRVDVDKPHAHELLWAADLIAWAHSAGGTFRAAISHLVTIHHV